VLFERLVHEIARRVVHRDGRRLLALIVSGDARREPGRGYRRMLEWAAETFVREDVETLDLDLAFRERARRERRYPAWEIDLHWNETGHVWVAETIYDWSRRLLDAHSARAPGP
jgi:hypothetical protein